jgi:FkbM family methyltransferase
MVEPNGDFPESCYVYGAGSFGRRLVEALGKADVDVKGVVDIKFDGTDPTRISPWDKRLIGENIVLGLSNPNVKLRGIIEILEASDVKKIVSPVEAAIFLNQKGQLITNYWMTGDISLYDNAEKQIEEAFQALEDSRSREVFKAVLEYRIHGVISAAPIPEPLIEIYAPPDLHFLLNGMRFVDAGAYDGDSIREMVNWQGSFDCILALEPDPENFAKLTKTASDSVLQVVCIPAGLGARTELANFNANGEASAGVAASGDTTVAIVRLDDVCAGWNPTHVKMDIEGAESAALVGMEGIIQMDRPSLAVSVYHSPEDHWGIINQIKSMGAGYKFFMRTYGEQTFDTVLYCIPR